jgi:hypothetical protein
LQQVPSDLWVSPFDPSENPVPALKDVDQGVKMTGVPISFALASHCLGNVALFSPVTCGTRINPCPIPLFVNANF